MSAAVLVELFALTNPRWRAWRLGGYPEREHLWARIKILALALVLIQGFFIARWIKSTATAFPFSIGLTDGSINSLFLIAAQILSLVGGTFFLYWLSRLVDSRGVGNGFSVMIVAFLVIPDLETWLASGRLRYLTADHLLLPVGLSAVAVAAVIRLAGGRPLRPQATPVAGDELPIPASGVQPIAVGYSLLAIQTSLKRFGLDVFPAALASETWTRRGLEVALTTAICVVFVWLFNRPPAVAAAWRLAGGPEADDGQLRDRVQAAFARSLAWSLVVCWALTGADWLCADAELTISVVDVTLIAAVVMDVAGEVKFRLRHGGLAHVWPVHRLYVLPGMLKALQAAGIPAYPRGRHHRTLWSFFVPYVPVEILVPVEHAPRAAAIVQPLAADG